MKISSILIMALAAGSLGAQDAAALDGRFQVFVQQDRPSSIVIAQTPGNVTDQPKVQTGVGVRFMGELASAPGFYYELGGMLDAVSYFTFNDGAVGNLSNVKFTESYWSLGAAYMAKFGEATTLGVHVEGRGESLRVQGNAVIAGTTTSLDQGTTYLRPWVRGSADYTFTGIGTRVHPFIGLDGAFAVTKTSQTQVPSPGTFDNRNLCSLAPKYSYSAYAGLRF